MQRNPRRGQTGERPPEPAPVVKQRDANENEGPFYDAKPDRLRMARGGDAQFTADGCPDPDNSHTQYEHRQSVAADVGRRILINAKSVRLRTSAATTAIKCAG